MDELVEQKKRSYWIYGAIIGLILSIILSGLISLCFRTAEGEEGLGCIIFLMPFFIAYILTGIDYLLVLTTGKIGVSSTFSFLGIFLGFLLFTLLGAFLGFLIDRKNPRKTKIVFLLILLIIFLPLSGYSNFLKYQDNKIIRENYYALPSGLDQWRAPASMKDCNKISIFKPDIKNKCIIAAAATLKDVKICDEIIRNPFNYDLPAYRLELDTDECIFAVANSSQNYDLCYKIKTSPTFSDYNTFNCIVEIALAKNDLERCYLIETQYKERCVSRIAMSRRNSSLCYGLKDVYARRDCFEGIAIELKDEKLCFEIKESALLRVTSAVDLCLEEVAYAKKDETICYIINKTSEREYCINRIRR